jgi:hypothetical protein
VKLSDILSLARVAALFLFSLPLGDVRAEQPASCATADTLRFAPPPLDHPVTLKLGAGSTYNQLADGQDYLVVMAPVKKVGSTTLVGGRNIVLIGGHVTLPVLMKAPGRPDLSNGAISRGIYIKNNRGIVHIEGLLVDASGGGMSDGIAIASPESTVQIGNVRIDGVFGFNHQFHADVVQPFGGVKRLRIDKLTGYSAYQGLTIGQDLGPIGSAEISRVNLVCIHPQINGPENNGGYMLWFTSHRGGADTTYPLMLDEVYIQPRKGQPLGKSVWPPPEFEPCPAVLSADGSGATWPSLPKVKGGVKKGLPPQGDFVPSGVAGLNYVSPGYAERPGIALQN